MGAREAVQAYAAAKSKADVETALQWCTDDIALETLPFQITANGHDEMRSQLAAFYTVFPDYDVQAEDTVEEGDRVFTWGTVSATMHGDFGSIAATGRSFTVPFSCVFDVRDGLVARERFYFDLNHLCEQLDVSTDLLAAELRGLRVPA